MGQNCQTTARPNRQCHQKPLEFNNAPKIRTRRTTTPFEDQHCEGNEIHSKVQIYLCHRARAIEIIFNEFHELQATQQQQQGQTQNTSQSANSGSRKENDWNNSDNSNHSQIAISTQKGDFLVEQIKNGAGDQSTYFLSPINSNRIVSTIKREPNTDYSLNATGEFLVMSNLWLQFNSFDCVFEPFFEPRRKRNWAEPSRDPTRQQHQSRENAGFEPAKHIEASENSQNGKCGKWMHFSFELLEQSVHRDHFS